MTQFAAYRARRLLIPFLLLGYLAMALKPGPAGTVEFYPFFNWSLFTSAPGERVTRPAILVRSIDGRAVEPPALFFDMTEDFRAAGRREILVSKLAGNMRRAVGRGDAETVERLRGVLERSYMSEVERAEYDLVLISYDPLIRLHTGQIDSVAVLASFRKEPD